MGENERENTLMTRTFKYLNRDTITALQSFQIERSIVKSLIFRYKQEMNTVLNVDVIILVWLRVILLTFVNMRFVVKNAENVLLWTAVNLLFILTKTNPNGMNLSWIH